MNDAVYTMLPDETGDQYLVRLGGLKDTHQINLTWTELAMLLNSVLMPEAPKTESFWRKRYHAITDDPDYLQSVQDEEPDPMKQYFREIEKQRIRARDERRSYERQVRKQARTEEILELFHNEIVRYGNIQPRIGSDVIVDRPKAMYVLLSDIHYGLTFSSYVGEYNSDLARKRLRLYANEIKRLGVSCSTCYISLLGDLISGIIHPGIRIENKETLIEQVVGVSELVSEFIYELASFFEHVYVNSVGGNHSRFDSNPDNVLRKERMDMLVPWYCKAKLSQVKNVQFVDNEIDETIGSFDIMGHLYLSVHGDLERDKKHSIQNISKHLGRRISYLVSGHTHVGECRFEDPGFIVNGSVCGSGDDYTIKKRLFGPPVQVCMICSENGIESVNPVRLAGVQNG